MQYLQIVLTIIEIVKIVEKLIPESGQGTNKLTLVRQLAEQAIGDISPMWHLPFLRCKSPESSRLPEFRKPVD